VELVTEAWFKECHSLPVVNKRFKSVARLAIRRMEDLAAAGQNKATYKTYTQVINNYLISLLGNYNVDRVDNAVLTCFECERLELMGWTPSASVVNNHNSALNRVFDEAIERGYMTKFQLPLLRNEGIKTQRPPISDWKTTPSFTRACVHGCGKQGVTMKPSYAISYATTCWCWQIQVSEQAPRA
jgi:hypothetical protein